MIKDIFMIKRKIDCHIHTNLSPDGKDAPEKIITAAIDMGLEHICLTDHMDLFYSDRQFQGVTDLDAHIKKLMPLKEKYAKQIYVCLGIECGWKPKNEKANSKAVNCPNLEYVINSVHEVNGSDCYYKKTYEGKTKDQSYAEFFNAVLSSLDAPYPFHAVGHLTYVSRYAPYSDRKISRDDYTDYIDAILKKLVQKGTILELNTNTGGSGAYSMPEIDIACRYRELGGEFITFSSDAHYSGRLCDGYEKVAQEALDNGFKYFTVIRNGKKKMINIED